MSTVSTMDCREVEELAGAIALGAVPDAEAADVSAHLAACPDAHALVAELLDVVEVLPLSLEVVEPAPSLRERLLAAAAGADGVPLAFPGSAAPLGGGARSLAQDSAPAPDRSHVPALLRPAARGRAWWRSPAWLAAAALFVVVVGLGASVGVLQHRLDQRDAQHQVDERVLAAVAAGDRVVPIAGSGPRAFLVQPHAGGTAYVVGAMPAAPAGKAYEAWVIRDGRAAAAGLFKPGSGYSVMPIENDLQGAQAVAFTVEPERGSAAPTLPLVAQFPLS